MRNSRGGFTLIEVMIAVSILATLAMLAARSIQQGIGAKAKIQSQIDDVSRLRDALRLMERDINLAYHHLDYEKEIDEIIRKKNGNPPLPNREAPRIDPATHFVGTSDAVNFVTMNNARMVRNSRQADFLEVGYALKDCRSADGTRSSKCLWRRSSQVVDKDVTVGGDEVVLLEDVSTFELQYIGKGKQDWVKTWRTDQAGDAVTKNNFPQAVEITLGVSKGPEGQKKNYKLTVVTSIHFPNNKEATGGTQTTGPIPPPR